MAVFITHSEQETVALGQSIGKLLGPGAIVLIHGDLGAGKTVLSRGISQGLGADEAVTSPTFTLMHRYQGRLEVFHFDLYRLQDPDEILDLGYDELFYGDGVSIVEWPERLDYLYPDECVRIEIEIIDYKNTRKISVEARGLKYRELEKGLDTL
ncbi:MAG: tRNA (adenosine(37)-N6)-threonylcarbamoyltransferase complex ATPase subunit type 1 TsaE [Clostridiales bacterium]|jgi:tRNA threonylcarbamoyladenosine biosynthesis protein TsaE|nr:tRNA (adenosine(37)-N6)-threonylcarbamoyltransferase complex ATPase subunit type 1 TsaE [Clostridiales bacterium]